MCLSGVTSARFIAQSALVKWSQLQLFKAKEGRSYLQGLVYIQILEFCRSTPPMPAHASAREHVTMAEHA
jgi:hypothetical protein